MENSWAVRCKCPFRNLTSQEAILSPCLCSGVAFLQFCLFRSLLQNDLNSDETQLGMSPGNHFGILCSGTSHLFKKNLSLGILPKLQLIVPGRLARTCQGWHSLCAERRLQLNKGRDTIYLTEWGTSKYLQNSVHGRRMASNLPSFLCFVLANRHH